jgi:hypothetical protein
MIIALTPEFLKSLAPFQASFSIATSLLRKKLFYKSRQHGAPSQQRREFPTTGDMSLFSIVNLLAIASANSTLCFRSTSSTAPSFFCPLLILLQKSRMPPFLSLMK